MESFTSAPVKKFQIGGRYKKRLSLAGYFFIAPAMLVLLIFLILPIISALILSFTEYSIPSTEPIRKSEGREHTIALEPEVNVTHAVLIFLIRVQQRLDPVTGFYDSFTRVKPERPTALLLKHIDGERFMRVRSR